MTSAGGLVENGPADANLNPSREAMGERVSREPVQAAAAASTMTPAGVWQTTNGF